MNGEDITLIDLGAEAAGHGLIDIAVVAGAFVVALVYLTRGLRRRRRGAAPACSGCSGCGASTSCPVSENTIARIGAEPDRPDRKG